MKAMRRAYCTTFHCIIHRSIQSDGTIACAEEPPEAAQAFLPRSP